MRLPGDAGSSDYLGQLGQEQRAQLERIMGALPEGRLYVQAVDMHGPHPEARVMGGDDESGWIISVTAEGATSEARVGEWRGWGA